MHTRPLGTKAWRARTRCSMIEKYRENQPVPGCIGTQAAAISLLPRIVHFHCSINEFG